MSSMGSVHKDDQRGTYFYVVDVASADDRRKQVWKRG